MWLAVSGLLNKQIAGELGTSEVTVKIHRGHAMKKMQARSFADLVRMARHWNRTDSSRSPESRLQPGAAALIPIYDSAPARDC
jgi:hypothetical protein